MPNITVIIPVYKVERFAERCARSLMEQDFHDVEFIFVDDASPDGSMEIIRRVCEEYDRDVKYLTHEVNKGLPAARNTGMAVAKGEFIYQCDSDDYLEPTLLKDLYEAATKEGADFAYCDFYLDFGTSKKYMTNPEFTDPERMIKEGFLAGTMKYNVWNKLVKKELYDRDGLSFPEGHPMGEDMTMIAVAMGATRCVHVPKALYHYMRTNSEAYTSALSQKRLDDIRSNVDRTIGFLSEWEVADKERFIEYFKLSVKLPFLFSGDKGQYNLWTEWYPEANSYIDTVPFIPRRTKMVQQWARDGKFFLVRLYSFAVNKIYYKLVRH